MTARPQDVALLPLPEPVRMSSDQAYLGYTFEQMEAYARANVTAALASAQAREEELRAEVERLTGCLATANANQEMFERRWYLEQDRAERLAEALRYALNQNEHDMVLTGDEIRYARAALSTNAATQTGE